MAEKITKRIVEQLTPGSLVWDTALPGFCARRRAGASVTYGVKYRTRSGRQRWLKLGTHGTLTPDLARRAAQQALADVAGGGDPAGLRQHARGAPTVNDLLDRFESDHVAKLRPRTAHEYTRLAAVTLRPQLGQLGAADVTADDIARLQARLKPTPVLANRALAILSKAFALAERWGMRTPGSNPCRGLERYREHPRTRRLSLEEITRLGAALTAAEAGPIPMGTTTTRVSPSVLAAIRLLLYTGCRRNEILSARWDMVDRDHGVLRLPESKTGRKDVVLSAPALAVIDGLPRIEENPFLLPGARHGHGLVNLTKPLAAILAVAGLKDVTPHTLRHTHASVGVDEGLSLPVIGRLLGHSQASTTQRYAHVQNPVRAASELVAGTIASALEGGAQ